MTARVIANKFGGGSYSQGQVITQSEYNAYKQKRAEGMKSGSDDTAPKGGAGVLRQEGGNNARRLESIDRYLQLDPTDSQGKARGLIKREMDALMKEIEDFMAPKSPKSQPKTPNPKPKRKPRKKKKDQ
jgi:hypothetical protein